MVCRPTPEGRGFAVAGSGTRESGACEWASETGLLGAGCALQDIRVCGAHSDAERPVSGRGLWLGARGRVVGSEGVSQVLRQTLWRLQHDC